SGLFCGTASRGENGLGEEKRIIVVGAEPGHQARLYLQVLEQGRPVPLTPEGVTSWAVSPDGSTIAARGPTPAIRLYPVDGTAARDLNGLTGSWGANGSGGARPLRSTH